MWRALNVIAPHSAAPQPVYSMTQHQLDISHYHADNFARNVWWLSEGRCWVKARKIILTTALTVTNNNNGYFPLFEGTNPHIAAHGGLSRMYDAIMVYVAQEAFPWGGGNTSPERAGGPGGYSVMYIHNNDAMPPSPTFGFPEHEWMHQATHFYVNYASNIFTTDRLDRPDLFKRLDGTLYDPHPPGTTEADYRQRWLGDIMRHRTVRISDDVVMGISDADWTGRSPKTVGQPP